MEEAIAAVKSQSINIRQATKEFYIPKSTLDRRVNNKNKIATAFVKHFGRHTPTFSPALERLVVNYVLDMKS